MSVAPDFLASFPGIVAAHLKQELPGLRTCEAIEGDFDVQELKRTGAAAPAVLIAMLGAGQSLDPAWPQIEFGLQMAAFIVTKKALLLSAASAGVSIAQHVLSILPEQQFGRPEAGPALAIGARNMVTKETRAAGVYLMAVTWTQPVVLLDLATPQQVPLQVYLGHAPEIGLAHVDDYTLIDPQTGPQTGSTP